MGDNIEMDFKEYEMLWARFIWLRVGTSGGCSELSSGSSDCIKG
jgi:hypothetical protein